MTGRSGWRYGRDIAGAVRHQLGLGDQPVNVWQVIRDRGPAVARPDFGPDGPDGLYMWRRGDDGPSLITVNRGKDWTRQHFTAAHELGHHEMHREGPSGLITDVDVLATEGDPKEQEANAFAAYFLAPDDGLRRVLDGRRDEAVTPEAVAEAAAHFGLSYEATLWRLRNTGLIREADRRRLEDGGGHPIWQLLSSAGARAEDWPGPAGSLPAQVESWALELYRRAVISVDRLADILQVSPKAAAALIAERGMERREAEPDEEAVLELLSGE
jgi:Zn-dependent peptidase ImmA (M78 family)